MLTCPLTAESAEDVSRFPDFLMKVVAVLSCYCIFVISVPQSCVLLTARCFNSTWRDARCLFCSYRCSAQLSSLLLQPQLPHAEPEQTSAAAPPQQPRPHHQGSSRLSYTFHCSDPEMCPAEWILDGFSLRLSHRTPTTSCSAVWKTQRGRGGVCLESRPTPLCQRTGNTTSPEKTRVRPDDSRHKQFTLHVTHVGSTFSCQMKVGLNKWINSYRLIKVRRWFPDLPTTETFKEESVEPATSRSRKRW